MSKRMISIPPYAASFTVPKHGDCVITYLDAAGETVAILQLYADMASDARRRLSMSDVSGSLSRIPIPNDVVKLQVEGQAEIEFNG